MLFKTHKTKAVLKVFMRRRADQVVIWLGLRVTVQVYLVMKALAIILEVEKILIMTASTAIQWKSINLNKDRSRDQAAIMKNYRLF